MQKEDSRSRIQREIYEVTEREREFKEGHFRINRLHSESTIDVNKQNGPVNGSAERTLNRAVSTSHLLGPVGPPKPATPATLITNGYTRRFTPQNGTKGIMQRFIANKGKWSVNSASLTSPTAIAPQLIFQPVRKGFVPVEEKIQKELREMKDREHQLKKMRKKQKHEFDIDLSDSDATSESDEEDIPLPGKLKATKSLGELYEALNEELRTPAPRNSSGQKSLKGKWSVNSAFPTSPTAIAPQLIFQPVRKGFVPVEEKIQKELREMKDREHELKKMRKKQKHEFDIDLSDSDATSESDEEDIPLPGKLKATKSLGELYEALNEELRTPAPRNSSGQKSLKGKWSVNSASLTSPTAIAPQLIFQPVRKGFVPVEEKIQKELRELKDREHELKKMRKKQKHEFDIDLSDSDATSESDEEDIPLPGKLKATKSLGELYEALNEELRTPAPRNSSGQESLGSLKPAKSLAELCELAPGQEFLAPSSTRLIAQWESIIQQKQ